MSAYLILFVDEIVDKKEMEAYREKAEATDASALIPLVAYGRHLVKEGPDLHGVAILEFESLAAANAWYQSDAYQNALEHRLRGARSRVVLVEGLSSRSVR